MSETHEDRGLGPKRSLLLKLTVVARQMHKRFDQRVASIGVTRSQWTMIAVIAGRPGATQREVAEVLDVSEASAGRLIDRLCADGMLERRRKDDDRRAHCVFLTDAAKPIMEALSVIGKKHEEEALAGFEASDLASFERYLDRITANIGSPVGLGELQKKEPRTKSRLLED
jgi:MarR family transcriptional regulator, transcriptional regulator for hemolysin